MLFLIFNFIFLTKCHFILFLHLPCWYSFKTYISAALHTASPKSFLESAALHTASAKSFLEYCHYTQSHSNNPDSIRTPDPKRLEQIFAQFQNLFRLSTNSAKQFSLYSVCTGMVLKIYLVSYFL